jgi:hypothetical protein
MALGSGSPSLRCGVEERNRGAGRGSCEHVRESRSVCCGRNNDILGLRCVAKEEGGVEVMSSINQSRGELEPAKLEIPD